MNSSAELLDSIRDDSDVSEVLAESFDFNLNRGAKGKSGKVSSGQPLKRVAGDFSGGTFYLCGDAGKEQPVLYASSEGQAGVIATSLREALEIIVGLPYWQDCLGYSGGGDLKKMKTAARHLKDELAENNPDISESQSQVADALSLDISHPDKLLTRLHSAVSSTDPDYVFSDETGEYESLFGEFGPERNMSWK